MTGQEALNGLIEDLQQGNGVSIICKEQVEKSLKALEIIKEKRVDLPYLRCCIEDNQSVCRYNEYINSKTMDYDHEEKLTEEEFELLRSVLE